MLILKLIRKFFRGLAGAESPTQIALGFGLGLMLGLVPFASGLALALLAVILIFKVSFPFALGAMAVAQICRVSFLSDLCGATGYWALESLPLQGFWAWALNLPVIGLLSLDRYAVMGGALLGAAGGAALFFTLRWGVLRYREAVVARLSKSKLFKTITNLWLMRALRWLFLGSGN